MLTPAHVQNLFTGKVDGLPDDLRSTFAPCLHFSLEKYTVFHDSFLGTNLQLHVGPSCIPIMADQILDMDV